MRYRRESGTVIEMRSFRPRWFRQNGSVLDLMAGWNYERPVSLLRASSDLGAVASAQVVLEWCSPDSIAALVIPRCSSFPSCNNRIKMSASWVLILSVTSVWLAFWTAFVRTIFIMATMQSGMQFDHDNSTVSLTIYYRNATDVTLRIRRGSSLPTQIPILYRFVSDRAYT